MRNKIAIYIYFICQTILFGYYGEVQAVAEPQNLQIRASFTEKKIESTEDIEKLFRQHINLGECIFYSTVPRGLIVSINSLVFFDDGQDEIKECSKEILNKIAELIKFINKPCIIEGNTSKDAYSTSIYRSDWEISMVRAEKIADYLLKASNLSHEQIRAIGFGELVPYDSDTQENIMNDRIDFVILNYSGSP